MDIFEIIEKQQKGLEGTTVFQVGEQLKDICRRDPACAAIVAEDLTDPAMGIASCEKKIKEFADGLAKSKKLRAVGVSAQAAEGIIRKFYGLPEDPGAVEGPGQDQNAAVEAAAAPEMLDLDDLLGL